MALIKVGDVAKKIGISVGDTIKRLQQVGIKVSSEDEKVEESSIVNAGIDLNPQPLDKRQEMIKRAIERHKKGVKFHEVQVNKNATSSVSQNRRVSKEELHKRRYELEKSIKKIDEERETYTKEKAEVLSNIHDDTIEIQETTNQNINLDNEVEATNEPLIQKQENDLKDKQEYTAHTTKDNKPRNQNDKNSRQQKQGERQNKLDNGKSDKANFQRRNDKNDGNFQRQNRSGDKQFNQRNDKDKPYGQKGFQGDKKSQSDRDKSFSSQNKSGIGRLQNSIVSNRMSDSLSLGVDEERKRLVRKKEDDSLKDKEKENKKHKSKKDSLKKPKSWTKTISEGLDELNIENEVEQRTISPNIDISDLADLDDDRRPKTQNFKIKFNNKPKKRQDKSAQKVFVRPEKVDIGERIVISDLGSLIGVKASELTKKLFGMGIMATVNQSIDAETAQLLGIEYGVDVVVKTITEDDLLPVYEDKPEELEHRPPIVTVMGHVDHGKTSLLDAIRSTSVAVGEAGGITQHIGAYEVESASGKVTFLDTPGHEAFTTLRARGALLTDIVILVVAADDGVKPQTKEAIDHAKAAGVRIVVAINKIDKDNANPDKVRQQLAEYGIIGDDWGGDYQFQNISAKKRIGIDDLLERVLLEAEVLDLKGNPNRPAEGVVIESRLDKQKGPVATILVKNGTLRKGDTFISGSQFGKVRAMFNYKGGSIKEAGVSVPTEIMGFSSLPEAGEKFIVADEKVIKQVAELRAAADKEKQFTERGKLSLSDLFGKIQDGELKELNIVLKADAQGSVEALSASLKKLSNQEVKVNIIHDGIGAITESDVALAAASKAIIIGFNVRPDNKAKLAADKDNIDIELYSVIYKAIDDVKLALEGLLSPEMKENVVGKVEIRQVFSVPKIGKIAGCFVSEGKVQRTSNCRVIRDSIVIFDGKIGSLKRFTDDVKEVVAGYECGLSVDKYQDIKEGDILEIYEVIEEKRTLEDVEKMQSMAEKANKE